MTAGTRAPRPARTLDRLLPDTWQGPSRQARWRRSRARRVLAGLLLAVAVACVVSAVRPADPPTRAVTVAARDLAAGHRLTAADVREVRWPAGTAQPGAVTASTAPGRVLVAPIRAGEALTTSRVRGTRSWAPAPAGDVVISVPADRSGLAAVLQPGDRVDVIDTAQGATVADRATVLTTVGPTAGSAAGPLSGSAGAERSGQVLLAMPAGDARQVGTALNAGSAGVGGGILLALRPID
ncbi:SAF domain-containing protein [Flexivirga meconopsidis]|uniref:SAF domain-containing protein n=1 Tax=Flexivirga meconopsidis TaxID=2977121 RepID=UPI002240A539|nr:SAF domain-containing protein [Flexivirga meconopsidis]